MLDFFILFGCKYTWNTAEDHCEILCWGLASGSVFNLCFRVKEEAGQWETVLWHPVPDGCLEEGQALRAHQGKAALQPLPWARPFSPLPQHMAVHSAWPLSREWEVLPSEGCVHFPGRWTNLNVWFCPGSHGLLTKEIKVFISGTRLDTDSCGCM